MDCDFTEEVSLLVDGELAPPEAARLGAHVEGCADCRQAREAFLLLRQELRSYNPAPDPHAQSAALAAILNSRAPGREDAAPPAGAWGVRPAIPRGVASRLFGRLGEAFGGRGLRSTYVAALALLIIGTALGLRWLAASYTSPRARQDGAPAVANTNNSPPRTTAGTQDGGKKSENPDAVARPVIHQAKTKQSQHPAVVSMSSPARRESAQVRRDVRRAVRQKRDGLSLEPPQESARAGEPALLPSSFNAVAMSAAEGLRAADDPSLRIGRHTERVERLLRSFRNARLTESDPTLDVADARRLSKRLLYNNITLRREAASAGNLPVEGLLDSVEPILIDISNLPDAPSQAAVGSIKERINRQQLVGVLQAQGMLSAR